MNILQIMYLFSTRKSSCLDVAQLMRYDTKAKVDIWSYGQYRFALPFCWFSSWLYKKDSLASVSTTLGEATLSAVKVVSSPPCRGEPRLGHTKKKISNRGSTSVTPKKRIRKIIKFKKKNLQIVTKLSLKKKNYRVCD